MRDVFAIDPGPEESAYVLLGSDGRTIKAKSKVNNHQLLALLNADYDEDAVGATRAQVVIEWIQGYGLTVGQSVFETCRWVGRFEEACCGNVCMVGRKAVKSFLCNTTTAKDQHVRESLIDRFGPVGTKKNPGPLYGVTGDIWSALAVAVTWTGMEMNSKKD